MGRGQASLFVIIGVVLLIIVGLAIFLVSNSKDIEVESDVPTEGYGAITYFIDTCVDSSTKRATIDLFRQGFYVQLDEDSEATYKISELETRTGIENTLVPYYWTGEYVIFPLEIELSSTYSKLFKPYFENCVTGLDVFEEQGFDFEKGDIKIKTTLNQRDVLFEVNWPITISEGDTKHNEQKFSKLFEYPVKEKYLILKNFVDYQATEEEYFQMGFLAYSAHLNNFEYEAFYLGEGFSLVKLEFPDFEEEYDEKLMLPFVIKA